MVFNQGIWKVIEDVGIEKSARSSDDNYDLLELVWSPESWLPILLLCANIFFFRTFLAKRLCTFKDAMLLKSDTWLNELKKKHPTTMNIVCCVFLTVGWDAGYVCSCSCKAETSSGQSA